MAIFAKISSESRLTQADVLELAGKSTDPYGNRFYLIELTAKEHGPHRFRIGGYQDVDVVLGDQQRTPSISYREEGKGTLKFHADKFGMLSAKCPKTPWNMKTLAGEFYDNRWTIVDAMVEKEVRELADTLPVSDDVKRRRASAKSSISSQRRTKGSPRSWDAPQAKKEESAEALLERKRYPYPALRNLAKKLEVEDFDVKEKFSTSKHYKEAILGFPIEKIKAAMEPTK